MERDRPYLAHLEFPTFYGKNEEYNTYTYTVRNLQAQCAPRDHKYVAPRLISNVRGSMSDDVRSMELKSSDYLVDDSVGRLLEFIRKRLNSWGLDLETEVFQKYFNELMRTRGETLTKTHQCRRGRLQNTPKGTQRSNGRRRRRVQ